MAKKISQFTEATTIKSGDISVVVQDGETKQFPLNLLATKAQADEYKADVETQLADYEQEITNIKNQYDKELYTPTITVTNTSMVKTGQGDTVDYSASVEDGVAKSAILKGNTLVNMFQFKGTYTSLSNIGSYLYSDNKITIVGNGVGEGFAKSDITVNLESNKTYTFKGNCDKGFNIDNGFIHLLLNNSSSKATRINTGNTTFQVSESGVYYVRLDIKDSSQSYVFSDLMILEGDYTNQDIPYFEGMQLVKMPVLKTTGKNLLNKNEVITGAWFDTTNGQIIIRGQDNVIWEKIKVEPNTNYISSNGVSAFWVEFDSNFNLIKITNEKSSIQTTINTKYITVAISITKDYITDEFLNTCQLECGTQVTYYEPFKSNILTVNEEVELRGIGDVTDELDLLTGEVVQNIGEIVFDGSEEWIKDMLKDDDTFLNIVFKTKIDNIIDYNDLDTGMLSDKFKQVIGGKLWSEDICGIGGAEGFIKIGVPKSYLTSADLDGFKQWLSQNPVTVQYQLATESVKTVDLTPSGTLASETPYMWKNGSIQVSSDGLVPGLDYEVTTSRVGVIETNMSETIVNEKRIHALEVMLAQSTITAAADAVSLQSDLEATTMSVDGAQLDTGNTQDDFLYEMILLLIEKDAYDESLFDKVCAFYLYGKLSDEQFTNIYSLLYPEYPEEE